MSGKHFFSIFLKEDKLQLKSGNNYRVSRVAQSTCTPAKWRTGNTLVVDLPLNTIINSVFQNTWEICMSFPKKESIAQMYNSNDTCFAGRHQTLLEAPNIQRIASYQILFLKKDSFPCEYSSGNFGLAGHIQMTANYLIN